MAPAITVKVHRRLFRAARFTFSQAPVAGFHDNAVTALKKLHFGTTPIKQGFEVWVALPGGHRRKPNAQERQKIKEVLEGRLVSSEQAWGTTWNPAMRFAG